MMNMISKKDKLEFLHYVVVFAGLLLSWYLTMTYLTAELATVAFINFFAFIVIDQTAHAVILKEKTWFDKII
jgi:hypothetical protein